MTPTTATIRGSVADSRTVTRFRGTPRELAAAHPELAQRATVTTQARGWESIYTYKLHLDRCAAHKYANAKDNAVQMVTA